MDNIAPTVWWEDERVKYIDQTKLPAEYIISEAVTLEELWTAIKRLEIRGAPALGVAAALGVLLESRLSGKQDIEGFKKELLEAASYIATSRPTAVNLFWALEKMKALVQQAGDVDSLKEDILKEAEAVIEEDKKTCRSIGAFGKDIIDDGDGILTHCNAGRLATYDFGTALGVMYAAKAQGKNFKVFADETRPLLQGARLTAWELVNSGIDATLICDNMAAVLMSQGKITKVITGADRIAANGDSANKIGTYGVAVLAAYHKIPFYIAAPVSTFDLSIATGADIPIEERAEEELKIFNTRQIAPEAVKVYNPAFDVTPNSLISGIITDKGIIRAPFTENIAKMIQG